MTIGGFTLIELLLSIALGAVILTTVTTVMSQVSTSSVIIDNRERLTRDASFAMHRMVSAARGSSRLVLPITDKAFSAWRENVREETVPESPPESGSSKATAVLAVAMSTNVDMNNDGIPDADNDGDGRINEDFPADITNDFAPGIAGLDDGGDGLVDEFFNNDGDDDEAFNTSNEDPVNGIDDDGDGIIDEDPGADLNNDGEPGIANVDDDGDGQVDEGSASDDDEDGSTDEDWLDAVVYFLQGDSLVERHPVPWDENVDGNIDGRDVIESVIAENVVLFRVERIELTAQQQMLDLRLDLRSADPGETVSLQTRVRVGDSQ
jgi:prepilin-type N-terminal cleavage/methylation domain-containing protein